MGAALITRSSGLVGSVVAHLDERGRLTNGIDNGPRRERLGEGGATSRDHMCCISGVRAIRSDDPSCRPDGSLAEPEAVDGR